ncbi:RHS repeat-associated core domain-containing protein [Flavobacterium pectinovorum]|uniref:RHS repeat domain-containing protein n=1 Tax=Flavobacterium pectinovorum TaxID=29533 RepID=UPI00265DD867|nr:RHS repeat-associated core domain-containing protein [Flavobacterium pectinovorum]WKL46344.1 RHS repeat-associated core domain-containing protein [Flavobacterium pectinovorum]
MPKSIVMGLMDMEKDYELKGEGNSLDFGARMLDPRIGRWFTRDPQSKRFPFESNYAYVSNNPLIYKDPTGEAKILTINYINSVTGKRTSISIVIDEDDIEYKVSKRNDYLTPIEYTWHDINIVQDIVINKDGSYTMGKTTKILLDPVKTVTERTILSKGDSESWARTKVDVAEVMDYIDSPGQGEIWEGGGIDFYSKSGEGSGVRARDRGKVDYVNGDDLIALISLGGTFAGGLKGGSITPHPVSFGSKFKLAKSLDKINEGIGKFEKYKKHLEQVLTPVFNKLNKPVVCASCHSWQKKLSKEPIDEIDITPEQRRDAEVIPLEEFHD